ncbi:SAM-dependent methyltransferase [Hydrogenophaga palleronii]|uniref:SAM-dependent methyltransferase n=1 Tax=Hydrogenophaga palleronii TaxID=65655 RepID=A0ABU1WTC2_9BURK|nr:class I SAM-dependent methyltransferase [Hydrogenophaga palleronii]MDR7152554.1 SAM-dependent methyltransferase [Hydrogenophaga palleronii]
MHSNKTKLLDEVAAYYTEKLAEHGETPRGVDWNGEESQTVRFEQLCKIIDINASGFSLNDLGCGYGALFKFLSHKYRQFSYLGVDVSEEMTHAAQVRHAASGNARFITGSEPDVVSDYGLASGIFNVRLERTDTEWYEYLKETLDQLDQSSRFGFSFNCLTSYSDEDKKRNYLYYADPCRLFDFCKRHYSKNVALLHDYGLYEFTILVRKG